MSSQPDNDFVDEVLTPAEQPDATQDAASRITATPDSVNAMLEAGKGPLAATESSEDKATKQLAENAKRRSDRQETQRRIERRLRLDRIRADKSITDRAGDFLRDMAGVASFTSEYRPLPWVRVTFRVMDSLALEEITTQNIRDMMAGRAIYVDEHKYYHHYSFAATLWRYSVVDPQSGEVLKVYDYEASIPEVRKHPAELGDTLVRLRWGYVMKEYFQSSSIYGAVLEQFNIFQQLIADLSFLAAEDPDFFQRCLTAEH